MTTTGETLGVPSSPDPDPARLYPLDVARHRLGGVGRTKMFELLRTGELRSVSIGSRRFIAGEDLDAYVERLRATAEPSGRVGALLAAIDSDGRIDLSAIPPGTSIDDLERAKRIAAERGEPNEAA